MGARKRRDRRAPAQPRQAARGGSRGDREPARRPVRDPAVILRLLAIAGVAAAFTAPAHAGTSLVRGNDGAWLAYGHDDQLSSAVVSRILDSRTVARLAQRWNAGLDGLVAASPLYAEPLVDGVRMGVVYVATEAGSVYALAAADGRILWQQPGATTALDFCGGFPLGVSSTGAIDRGRNVLYVVGSDGLLNAYDLTTGAEAEGYPLQVVVSPADQYVWGGLRIVGATLYVPVSSFCDQLDASGLFPDGGLVAVDLTDPSSQKVFDAVPGPGNGGGAWGYRGGPVEPGGRVLLPGGRPAPPHQTARGRPDRPVGPEGLRGGPGAGQRRGALGLRRRLGRAGRAVPLRGRRQCPRLRAGVRLLRRRRPVRRPGRQAHAAARGRRLRLSAGDRPGGRPGLRLGARALPAARLPAARGRELEERH